jgi:aspartyl-tRNA(Asn)/glutamyl-tRNA(Gln) amidotransferase subunit B
VRSKINGWGLDKKWIKQIAKNPHTYNLLKKVKEKDSAAVSLVGKILIHEGAASDMSVDSLVDLAQLIREKKPPSNIIRKIIEKSVSSNKNPKLIYNREFSMTSIDINKVVDEILSENSDAVSKIKLGKEQVIGFLVGEVMRKTKGNINPNIARQIIIKKIHAVK